MKTGEKSWKQVKKKFEKCKIKKTSVFFFSIVFFNLTENKYCIGRWNSLACAETSKGCFVLFFSF